MARTAKSKPEAAGPQGLALVIIDMISCWDFPDAEHLSPGALAIAPTIARFKARCMKAGVPVIYANDNRGLWRSDFRTLVEQSLAAGGVSNEITRILIPQDGDYFILKPKHSAFHATPLTLLLSNLKVERLVLAGVASDQCIMTSASEARMRDLQVVVPSDLAASQTEERHELAMWQLREAHKIVTPLSSRIRLPDHPGKNPRP